jgi:pre-rRNA-processing protein TSR4
MTNKKKSSSTVQLGFCVPIESRDNYLLVGHRTRQWKDWDGGQIGGVPSWLAGPPPGHDDDDDAGPPTCQVCHSQMDFIGQLYAPKDDDDDIMPHAFHRTLYIFGCPVDNDQVMVWRCNLPRDNPYWPYRGDKEEEDLDHGDANNTTANATPLCVVCGFPSSSIRGGVCPVQNLPFCGRAHQQYHYYYHSGATTKMSMEQAAADDDDDDVPPPPEQQRGIYTPMYELVVEEEEYDDESDNDDDDGNVDTVVPAGDQPEPNSEKEDDPDAYLEQADLNAALLGRDGTTAISQSERDDEVVYEKFRDRIADDKNQVLRYGGDDVLWMTAQYPTTTNIPPCDHCGQPRQYEFQLMPQLLHYLKRARQQPPPAAATAAFDGTNDGPLCTRVELEEWSAAVVLGSAMTSTTTTTVAAETAPAADHPQRRQQRLLLDDHPELDWGVVAVYTCRASCCSSQYRYMPEYAYVQPSIASLSSS